MNIDFENFRWLNQPQKFELGPDSLVIETSPKTDLWQRTFYGFQNDNAPAFLTETDGDFTFRVKTEFSDSRHLYDQCGILMYLDSENWVKVSVEYENDKIARLGSVVTNLGFSDWATCDISSGISEMWYRISRRGQDFYLESSTNGNDFQQMRMLHMHIHFQKIRVGVYACSPLQSSFRAVFTEFKFETAIQNFTETKP
ncbi:MAG: DUF1349 domain-containing protein [Bacteroidia bacterium]|nr:DUF1349 domain-containing protein [Bacteroidia bacterium]